MYCIVFILDRQKVAGACPSTFIAESRLSIVRDRSASSKSYSYWLHTAPFGPSTDHQTPAFFFRDVPNLDELFDSEDLTGYRGGEGIQDRLAIPTQS